MEKFTYRNPWGRARRVHPGLDRCERLVVLAAFLGARLWARVRLATIQPERLQLSWVNYEKLDEMRQNAIAGQQWSVWGKQTLGCGPVKT